MGAQIGIFGHKQECYGVSPTFTNPTVMEKISFKPDRIPRPCVTFIFDDSYVTDLTVMLPVFQAQGEVACSAIVTSVVSGGGALTWDNIRTLRDAGWEITSHTVTHPNLTTLTEAQLITELADSKATLAAQGCPTDVVTYPGGYSNDLARSVTARYYKIGRDGSGLNSRVIAHYRVGSIDADDHTQLAAYQAIVDRAIAENVWAIFYLHQTDANDAATVDSLIDYIQANNVEIVTMTQGMAIHKNFIDNDSFGAGHRGIRIGTPEVLNLGLGHHAGRANTTGASVSVGYQAGMSNTTGTAVSVGYQAGMSNTTGQSVSIGYEAGRANIGGSSVSIGHAAGRSNTTGSSVSVGHTAGYANTSGRSVNVGYLAGYANTTGFSVAIGFWAGTYNTTGQLISIGYAAGQGAVVTNAPKTDTYGILIGYEANRSVVSATVLANYIGIGYGVLIDKSNQVKIGNTSITEINLHLNSLPLAANNAGAAGAGILVGGLYRTNADPSIVCIRSA